MMNRWMGLWDIKDFAAKNGYDYVKSYPSDGKRKKSARKVSNY